MMPTPEVTPRKRRISPFLIWLVVLALLLALGIWLLTLGLAGTSAPSLFDVVA